MEAKSAHHQLLAWQEAMKLVEFAYRDTKPFPKEEIFGLTAQIRRSAVSVPSNIAEGAWRNSSKELAHFLGIACGSLAELQTQVELSARLGFLGRTSELFSQVERVGQLLIALRKSIRGLAPL
ncbi:MAG: four helix bundle protein [Burkholderiales bacterium]